MLQVVILMGPLLRVVQVAIQALRTSWSVLELRQPRSETACSASATSTGLQLAQQRQQLELELPPLQQLVPQQHHRNQQRYLQPNQEVDPSQQSSQRAFHLLHLALQEYLDFQEHLAHQQRVQQRHLL